MTRAVVNPTLLSEEKSYDVTIQMKPLWQTFYLVLLFFRDFKKWNLNFMWISTLATIRNAGVNSL